MSGEPLAIEPNIVAMAWVLEYASHFNVARIIDAFAADNHRLLRALLQDVLPGDQERCLLNFCIGMLVNVLRNPSKLDKMPVTDVPFLLDAMIPATTRPRTIRSSYFCVSTELKAWVTMYYVRTQASSQFEAALESFFSPTAAANDAAEGESAADAALRANFYSKLKADFIKYASDIATLRDAASPATTADADAAAAAGNTELATELRARAQAAAAAVPYVNAANEAVEVLEKRFVRDIAIGGALALAADIREERGWDLGALDAVVEGLRAPAAWTAAPDASTYGGAGADGGDLATFQGIPIQAALRGAALAGAGPEASAGGRNG